MKINRLSLKETPVTQHSSFYSIVSVYYPFGVTPSTYIRINRQARSEFLKILLSCKEQVNEPCLVLSRARVIETSKYNSWRVHSAGRHYNAVSSAL